jgi:hypothetical protein
MTSLEAILLGAMLGTLAASVTALFLFFTRSARRVRNMLAIGAGYVFVGGSAIGSLILLLSIGDQLGVGRKSSQHAFALDAYLVAYGASTLLAGRAELRWRKSVGL